MDGRTLEHVANFSLLFCALVLPGLLWIVSSHLGTVPLPWSMEALIVLYLVFLVVVCLIYYPVIKIVEGIQVAKYKRLCQTTRNGKGTI